MDSVKKLVGKVLFGEYRDWTSGFFFLVLPPIVGWIIRLLSGNTWAAVTVGSITLTLVLVVVVWRQRSRLRDVEALKAGLGLHEIRLDELELDLVPVSHPELPRGQVWLRWAKFHIASAQDGTSAAMVAVVRPTAENKAGLLDVGVGLDGVSEVYLLATVDYGVKSYRGALPGAGWDEKRVGHIELVFADGSKQEHELRLGHDIRDFSYGNQPWAIDSLRKEGATSFQVWHSSLNDFTLDLVVIEVRGKPKRLDKIRIEAQMEEGLEPVALRKGEEVLNEPAYPAIWVFGLTCRTTDR